MKLLCGIICVFCLSACSYTQISPPFSGGSGSYTQGRIDGEQAYKTSPGWLVAGVGCGIFAVGYAWVVPPEPPAYALEGKEAEYALGFKDGYGEKGRRKNATSAALGWAMWILIVIAISSD